MPNNYHHNWNSRSGSKDCPPLPLHLRPDWLHRFLTIFVFKSSFVLTFLFLVQCARLSWLSVSLALQCSPNIQYCIVVYLQPPTSANNMTLLAFAAERRAAAVPGSRHCPPARRAHSSNPLHAAAAVNIGDRQADGQTDTIPLHKPYCILCTQCR